ncbi:MULTISPECIES: hypothetical protein [unclassified Clostridium]|uniref:hypothetical protein n=1 Tax=unclassified Clostridium TaxID=2614128 RepID=UPI0002980B33|nr:MULTISPECIES: hypothetical protein [unclassified Clostridium]EKQ56682.1 MAG: hypothetical protein A370_01757 [Clostridium sp. Maddingley MBC34-26]
MNYTISDLIQKLIDIEKDILSILKRIEHLPQNKLKVVGIIARAIEKQEQKHIQYYEQIKNNLCGELNETIDFFFYDKVAKLLYEFRSHIQEYPQINNAQDLIKYAVGLKKDNIGLLLDIQGRLLGKADDVNNNVYKVIEQIIKEEEKQEKMFEQLIISKK